MSTDKECRFFGSKHCKIYRTYQNLSFGVVPFARDLDEIKKIEIQEDIKSTQKINRITEHS